MSDEAVDWETLSSLTEVIVGSNPHTVCGVFEETECVRCEEHFEEQDVAIILGPRSKDTYDTVAEAESMEGATIWMHYECFHEYLREGTGFKRV